MYCIQKSVLKQVRSCRGNKEVFKLVNDICGKAISSSRDPVSDTVANKINQRNALNYVFF